MWIGYVMSNRFCIRIAADWNFEFEDSVVIWETTDLLALALIAGGHSIDQIGQVIPITIEQI